MAEKEYISRIAFRQQLKHRQITAQYVNARERHEIRSIIEMLDKAPAADVVPVVRCKDCVKYFRDTPYCAKHNKGYCHLDGLVKSENHYCGYGEREELNDR